MITRCCGWMMVFVLLMLMPALGGCRASYTYVLEAPARDASVTDLAAPPGPTSLRIVHDDNDSASLSEELDAQFRAQLRTCLRTTSRQELGEGAVMLIDDDPPDTGLRSVRVEDRLITLHYRVVLMAPGNSPLRVGSFLVSLIGAPVNAWGEGKVGVEVRFADDAGRTLARIVVDGPIDGPLASQRDGLDLAAESIAKYATRTVLRPPSRGIMTPAS